MILRNIVEPDTGCEELGFRISGRFRGTKVQSISDIMDVRYLDENISSVILYKIVELELIGCQDIRQIQGQQSTTVQKHQSTAGGEHFFIF